MSIIGFQFQVSSFELNPWLGKNPQLATRNL
jgi:hypothetical protein